MEGDKNKKENETHQTDSSNNETISETVTGPRTRTVATQIDLPLALRKLMDSPEVRGMISEYRARLEIQEALDVLQGRETSLPPGIASPSTSRDWLSATQARVSSDITPEICYPQIPSTSEERQKTSRVLRSESQSKLMSSSSTEFLVRSSITEPEVGRSVTQVPVRKRCTPSKTKEWQKTKKMMRTYKTIRITPPASSVRLESKDLEAETAVPLLPRKEPTPSTMCINQEELICRTESEDEPEPPKNWFEKVLPSSVVRFFKSKRQTKRKKRTCSDRIHGPSTSHHECFVDRPVKNKLFRSYTNSSEETESDEDLPQRKKK